MKKRHKKKSELIDACEGIEDQCGFLNIDGTEYKTIITSKFKKRKIWKAPNENHIKSYIPGTILEILVKPGDEVEIGTPLLILEAMKMQNKIVSHKKARVKEIKITEQQIVPKGELMLVLE